MLKPDKNGYWWVKEVTGLSSTPLIVVRASYVGREEDGYCIEVYKIGSKDCREASGFTWIKHIPTLTNEEIEEVLGI